MSKRRERRALTCIEDSVDKDSKTSLKKSERLISPASNFPNNRKRNRTTKTKKQKWRKQQFYGYLKYQTGEILHEKTWTWFRKGSLKWETEYLLIVAEINAIKTKYVKAKIATRQQNSMCRLCGDKDEMINQHEIHKILQDFEIEIIHLILARKRELMIIKKK